MRSKQFTVTAAGSDTSPSIRISTGGRDRDGDRLLPEGCDTSSYKKNPVVLFGHNYNNLPVGGDAVLTITPGKDITASWRWLQGDEFAARVKNAFEQRFLSASVGFKPKEVRPNEFGGHDILKWELLEFSLVPVPANPECTRALKSLGLLAEDQDIGLAAIPYVQHKSGGEVLTDLNFADVLHLDDEEQLVDWPLPVIDGIVRRTVTQAIADVAHASALSTINYMRGRVD